MKKKVKWTPGGKKFRALCSIYGIGYHDTKKKRLQKIE